MFIKNWQGLRSEAADIRNPKVRAAPITNHQSRITFKRMKKSLIVLFLLTSMFSCSKKAEKTQPVVEDITESVYASGIVKSKNQYQVFSTVNGLIQEVFVAEGGLVKKGDPILRVLNESSSSMPKMLVWLPITPISTPREKNLTN